MANWVPGNFRSSPPLSYMFPIFPIVVVFVLPKKKKFENLLGYQVDLACTVTLHFPGRKSFPALSSYWSLALWGLSLIPFLDVT
jgi:hypothetical protein